MQVLVNYLPGYMQPPDWHRFVDVGETSVLMVQQRTVDMRIDAGYCFLFV